MPNMKTNFVDLKNEKKKKLRKPYCFPGKLVSLLGVKIFVDWDSQEEKQQINERLEQTLNQPPVPSPKVSISSPK
jgi:hypothetical protein